MLKPKLHITAGKTIHMAVSVLICIAAAASVSLLQKKGECQKEEEKEEQDKASHESVKWKRLDSTCGVEPTGDPVCRLVKPVLRWSKEHQSHQVCIQFLA